MKFILFNCRPTSIHKLAFCALTVTAIFSGCLTQESPSTSTNDTPPKKTCEIQGTGEWNIANRTSYIVKITIDGLLPSGFGSVGPNEDVTAIVTANGVKHTYKAVAISNPSIYWEKEFTVGTCQTTGVQLAL